MLRAIAGGDSRVLPELIRRNDRWVRGIAFAVLGRHDDIDDVVQQVWLRVWRELFVGERPSLDDTTRWRAWLYRITRNAAIDAVRRGRRRQGLIERLMRWAPRWASSDRHDGRATSQLHEEHQRAMKALAGMPAIYREAFVLKHLESWSYQEIADVLRVPVDTVETRLIRARRILRQRLGNDER